MNSSHLDCFLHLEATNLRLGPPGCLGPSVLRAQNFLQAQKTIGRSDWLASSKQVVDCPGLL